MKKRMMIVLGAAATLPLAGCNQQPADYTALKSEVTAMHDRIAIEDLLLDYYTHLGSGSHHGFDKYFTDDAQLNVNGWKASGLKAIQGIYDRAGAEEAQPAKTVPVEKEHMDYMHLTNPLIHVNGDTATAKVFWTGVISDDLNAPPQFEEMGREYDLLVKKDGAWKIKKRVVIADAGMPESMNKTYRRMRDYDVTKDD